LTDHSAFYDRIASVYDTLADSSERDARRDGLEALAPQPGERILEIGFGTGHALVELAEAGARVYGVDVSAGMAREAKRRLEREDVSATIILGDARCVPLRDAAFDVVFLSFTLELFEDGERPRVLAECRRLLRDGGRLGVVAMAEPGEGERDSFLEKGYRWMHRHFPHIVDCRPIDVAKEIQAAGFRLDRLKSREIWTMPVRAAVGVKV